MVVDDDPDSVEIITAVLKACRTEVRSCLSTREALQLLIEWKPGLLISDIGMPEEDGYKFIRKVRALKTEERDIPAAALTAYAGSEARALALAAGFQVHIPFPNL
ncbi:MAG TPA: response regulator [Pyrinomonadaceae bacterium]|nr:response regulator [Pyrinomonadaceae bacterium]